VALTSGAIGAALFLGIFHAIGLLNHDLRPWISGIPRVVW
jgi:hypothetical protein